MENVVFLIGFMGAGKSRFGKKIAKRLGYAFLDSDLEIQKEQNSTIAALFEKLGEDGFRTLETEWLNNLNQSNVLVALGGGTPCFNNNMSTVNVKGISVYLNLKPAALAERLMKSKTVRPIIAPYKQHPQALITFIDSLLQKREVFYQQADITISGINISASKMEALVELIHKHQCRS